MQGGLNWQQQTSKICIFSSVKTLLDPEMPLQGQLALVL
jgi:hypothetical protein